MSNTMPSPTELGYFIEVASTRNISRAAERLGVSQPTLSLAIQRLENSFGIPLLIRTKSGVSLTQGGQKLVARARTLLHEWDKIRDEAVKDDDTISGRYVIGCHPSVAIYSVPLFMPKLMNANPSLEIRLVHDLSRKVTEEVVSFKIDFAIVVNPVEHPDLVIKPLCKDEVSLWSASSGANEDVLICDTDLMQTQKILKLLAKKGLNFKRTVTSSNLEVITALVAAGAGVGILPGRVATRVKALGIKPYPSGVKFPDQICLIYRADAQRTKSSRQIASFIEKSFSEKTHA